jgi:signal transduction histidine kinase
MIVMTTHDTQTIPILTSPTTASSRVRAGLDTIGRDFAYLLGAFTMSIVGFVIWVTALSVTASLLVLIIGVFVWVGSLYAFRWTTAIDRRLASWLRRDRIEAVYRRPPEPGFWSRLKTMSTDPQTWKEAGWLVGNSIIGFAATLIAISVTALVLAWITLPIWWWAIPNPHDQYATLNFGIFTVTSLGWAFVTMALGLITLPLALLLNRGIAAGHASIVANVLGPSERQRLNARVRELASTRSDVVNASNEQLRRIERDLHDGAQARLVALAMELGMAEEELANDPDAARTAVRKAREEALGALGELRDISRGLRPALLQERGLRIAIEDLAQRSTTPATTQLTGPIDALSDDVATAVYFVAAEALTNATKHSGATSVRLAVQKREHDVTVTVLDNGQGGANATGSGLDGLRARVRALDGRFEVQSPPGGPTLIRAELPCA